MNAAGVVFLLACDLDCLLSVDDCCNSYLKEVTDSLVSSEAVFL